MCCDFIYAARHARFALPEVTRGIMPGAGATQNLPRAVGVRRAKEIIMSGLPFSAEQAHEWGMVNEVCDAADLMPKVMTLAKTICDNAPISVRQIKKAVNASMNLDLQSGLAFEIQCYERMISTEDRHEGVRAFNEKRKPQFKGRMMHCLVSQHRGWTDRSRDSTIAANDAERRHRRAIRRTEWEDGQ